MMAASQAVRSAPAPGFSNLAAEEHLLSALVADHNTIMVVRELVGPDAFSATPKTRAVAKAVWACLDLQPPVPPTVPAVVDRLTALGLTDRVPGSYLSDLDDRGTRSVILEAPTNARLVAKLARVRRAMQYSQELSRQIEDNPDDLESILSGATQEFYQILDGSADERPHDIRSILAAARERPADPVTPTGLRWLDDMAKGWQSSKIWAISGQYKARKTTIAMYLLMRALSQGKNISVFTVDDDRETFARQIVAMWATAILRHRGVPANEWRLDADFLALPAPQRTPAQHQAISQAEARLEGIWDRLRVYDVSDFGGEYEHIERALRRDVLLHGCNMYLIDFLQDLELDPKSPYRQRGGSQTDTLRAIVRQLKAITKRYKLTALWISQLNDQALQGRSGKSAGTMGGIVIPAACDYLVETKKEDDWHFTISLRFGRRTANGAMTYNVNPPSGLILNPDALPY
jgi:replicative DNA helicase